MNTADILDFSLNELIKKNYEKIQKNSSTNPSLSKDDEWRDEDFWEELYKELND